MKKQMLNTEANYVVTELKSLGVIEGAHGEVVDQATVECQHCGRNVKHVAVISDGTREYGVGEDCAFLLSSKNAQVINKFNGQAVKLTKTQKFGLLRASMWKNITVEQAILAKAV